MAEPLQHESLERSPEQVRLESAMREVSETLMNVEQALRRAKRAHRAVVLIGTERNAEVALATCVEQLEATRKALFQSAYFGGDQQRLM